MVLVEKGVPYSRVEVNPFASDMPKDYLSLHPFRRVPTLVHDDFVLYETQAITRYIDEAFAGPSLQPVHARQRVPRDANHFDHRRLRVSADGQASVLAARIRASNRSYR